MIRFIFNILAGVTSMYMLLIFVRVLLSWFSSKRSNPAMNVLCSITDPYLNWFRRFSVLRTGVLDFSPIVAIAVVSLVNNVCTAFARSGVIRVGFILALAVSAIWAAISFILGFFLVVLIIRLFGYLTNQNVYSGFWRIVDALAQPVLYQVKRIIFGRRIVHYVAGVAVAIGVLAALMVAGGFCINRIVAPLLASLPL